jgi:hypothetical protein
MAHLLHTLARSLTLGGLWLLLVLLVTACQPIAIPIAPQSVGTPEPVAEPSARPEVTVEVSENAITLPDTWPAGLVTVQVQNNGEAPHAPIFARLAEDRTLEDFLGTMEQIPAALEMVTLLGGVSVDPGATGTNIFELEAGDYFILDFAGAEGPLTAAFTVEAAQSEVVGATAPQADVQVDMLDFSFILPDEITAGPQLWQVSNSGNQWHHIQIVQLDEGVTVADLIAMLASHEPPSGPPPFTGIASWQETSSGVTSWGVLDLAPGEYTVICFLPDFTDLPPASHLVHGMVRTLRVVE